MNRTRPIISIIETIGFGAVMILVFFTRVEASNYGGEYHKQRMSVIGKRYGIHSITNASSEVLKAVELIANAAGLENRFVVLAAKFKTSPIAFTLPDNGHLYIVYDANFFKSSDYLRRHHISTLAHEIGHLIQWPLKRSNWDEELFADKFSGFITSRLGGSLENATSIVPHLSLAGSLSHPPRLMRYKAYKEGWEAGEKQKAREAKRCTNEWTGEVLNVEGQMCRIAQYCKDGDTKIRLACQDYEGQWVWIK